MRLRVSVTGYIGITSYITSSTVQGEVLQIYSNTNLNSNTSGQLPESKNNKKFISTDIT
jgi:hypothetical protein